MNNMLTFIDLIYDALSGATAYAGYSPSVIIFKGARDINSISKQYSIQIIPQSLEEGALTHNGSYNRVMNITVVGIIKTNDVELFDGGTGRKGATDFVEDTFELLSEVKENWYSKTITKVDLSRMDIDYQLWPNVAFTINVNITYENKYGGN